MGGIGKKVVFKNKRPGRKPNNLIELYKNYDLEEIKKAVNSLDEKQQDLVLRAYGKNLDNHREINGFTNEEISSLNVAVYQTIKKALSNPLYLKEKAARVKAEKEKAAKAKKEEAEKKTKLKAVTPIIAEVKPVSERKEQEKFKEGKVTDYIEKDFINKFPEYKKMTTAKQRRMLKSIKMSYYNEATPEEKKQYLEYFCDVYPWVKEKLYSDISETEKNKLINEIILIAKETRDEFVEKNIKLVYKMAYRYTYSKIPTIDLIQEGIIGMMKAIEKFDPKKNCHFSTYALWWIRQSISRYIKDKERTIKIPVHILDLINKIRKAEETLYQELKTNPTNEQIAEKLKINVKEVEKIKNLVNLQPSSLDKPIGEEEDSMLGYFIADEHADFTENVHNAIEKEQIISILENYNFNKKEKTIICMRYGLLDDTPRTLQEIGDMYGVSRERIRQIENFVLKRLRENYQIMQINKGRDFESPKTKKKKI